MLGFFLSFILIFIVFLIFLFGVISFVGNNKEVVTVSPKSILYVTLDQPIQERTSKNPFEDFKLGSFSMCQQLGLNDILANIKKAKNDNNIEGIFLEVSAIPSGIATIEEIRNALIDFKKSKKFIYAYSEVYTQTAYYVASVADKIYLNPQGMLDFRGLRAELMFFKGTLEKLELEPQIIRHGKFKSAIEPFILDKMSDENRKQTATYIGSIWNQFLEGISKERKMDIAELTAISDSMLIRNPNDAVHYKMVDALAYKDEVLSDLRKKINIKESDKIKFIALKKYANTDDEKEKGFVKEKIAIIYAVGEIESGKGEVDKTIGSEKLSETIRKARLDKNIKAIVLRVNSPGGSALASDVIWREVVLAKKTKPVVVSMGDVAASGGYYISCAADTIVAEPTTITGSIGVFGILLNAKKLLNNKLGITVDTVKTGHFADIGSVSRPLTAAEKIIIQKTIEIVYDTFITRVANGRHLSVSQVDSIGQGRVWSGTDAKKIGLVDVLGGLDDATAIAAKMAKLIRYRIVSLPEQKEPITEILDELSGGGEEAIIKHRFGNDAYNYYQQTQSLLKIKGVQARLPFVIDVY